ncbi:hypothetical protein D3C87_1050480 [compost metagenome]
MPVGGQGAVDVAHAVEVTFQRAAQIVLARKVGAIAHPHRQRRRAQRTPQFDAVDIVLDGLRAHGRAMRRQAAVFVRLRLSGLVLEGIRIDGVKAQAVSLGGLAQGGRVADLVPWKMQRDGGRRLRQLVDDGAIFELFKHVARFAQAGETGKARAARAGAPAGYGHGKRLRQRRQFFNVLAAAGQHTAQGRIVGVQVRLQLGIVVGHQAAIDHGMHLVSLCAAAPWPAASFF